jgi:hypothetical protein
MTGFYLRIRWSQLSNGDPAGFPATNIWGVAKDQPANGDDMRRNLHTMSIKTIERYEVSPWAIQ